MSVSTLEKLIGLKVHSTSSIGLGGIIRQRVEDFVVEEVLVDGSKAQINPLSHRVLGSNPIKNRYLICILVKRDWDMFLALRTIAKRMKINPQRIQIAGIKDAKAVTAQHITIEDVTAEIVSEVELKDMKLYPIGYYHNELSPYYLLGNEFHITIRSITHSKSKIKKLVTKTVRELKKLGGIPNFFGHQRFGTIRPITHLIGKAIVQGNFEKAVMLYLAKPSFFEHPDSRKARTRLHETQDFQKALEYFPKQLRYERWMLKHLANKRKDFIGALRKLPLKIRTLFTQAYQAYLFNESLSERIREGLPLNKAETGDYVMNVDRYGLPMPRTHRIVSHNSIAEINKTIHDGRMRVAIPILGFKQSFSTGRQGDIEKQILRQENIALEHFKVSDFPEASFRGTLRTTITPLNLLSLNKITEDNLNAPRFKIEINFMLHRGSYATIFLRELMKPNKIVQAGF
ncbi:MAG: tRNA pseudouridine(13) synthase TruD [Candidatus Bathyarchaeota archaeon]